MKGEIAGLPRGLVYPPIGRGPGAGKAFFFFSGFVTSTDTDMAMRMTDIEHLGDDVAALRAAGFSVVVDLHGELTGLNQALAGTHPDAPGLECAGIFWSGHGDDDGTLQDYQGFRIKPEEIAPDATARGSVKLFVQSACYVGGAVASWQKALGQQALIIGWGAPLSNDRAVDFLTPDEESSKDFDDLLRRHLGVSAVIQDGPLHEIRELAQKHEAKTAVLLLDFDDLVEAVNARSKNLIKKEGKAALFGVLALPSKERPEQRRKQLVRVQAIGISDVFVSVSSLVGPYSDALDLPRAIRMLDSEPWVKLTVSKIVGPSTAEPAEFVLLESIYRRRRLDPLTLARSIISVGILADRLEDLFFGSDVR